MSRKSPPPERRYGAPLAYDERLAKRVRDTLGGHVGISERKMFGGITFMLDGNMCCGVHGEELILRLGEKGAEAALADRHARPFDLAARPMKAWVLVHGDALASDDDLRGWLQPAIEFASSLPPK